MLTEILLSKTNNDQIYIIQVPSYSYKFIKIQKENRRNFNEKKKSSGRNQNRFTEVSLYNFVKEISLYEVADLYLVVYMNCRSKYVTSNAMNDL